MYENFNLSDAFKALNSIQDEEVTLPIRRKSTRKLSEGYSVNLYDSKEAEEAIDILDESSAEPELEIIDVDADTLDHLKKKEDYVGQMIMKCKVCQALKFMDADKLEEDPDKENIFNTSDECPNCHAEGKGFEVVGQVGQVAKEKEVIDTQEDEIAKVDNDLKDDSEEAAFDNDFQEESNEEPEAVEEENVEELPEENAENIEIDNTIEDEEETPYDETDAEDDTEDLDLPTLGDEIDPDDVPEDDTAEKDVKEALEDEESTYDQQSESQEDSQENNESQEELENDSEENEAEEEAEEKEPILVSDLFDCFVEPENIKKVRIIDEDAKVIFEDKFENMLPNIKEAQLVGINPDGIIINVATEAEDGIDFSEVAEMLAIDEDNADKATIIVDEEEVKVNDKSDALAIEGKVSSIEPTGTVELYVAPVEDAEEVEQTDQSDEDDLLEDIIEENYLSMDKINNINSNEYWIRESINTKEDLDVIFESFVLPTENMHLVNKFKRVTGFKDAIDEAIDKLGYKAEIVENLEISSMSTDAAKKLYDEIIAKAQSGVENAMTLKQVLDSAREQGVKDDFDLTELTTAGGSDGLITKSISYFDQNDQQIDLKMIVARPADFDKWEKEFGSKEKSLRAKKLSAENSQKNSENLKDELADLEYAFDNLDEEEKANFLSAVKNVKLMYPEGNEDKKEAGYKWFGEIFDSAVPVSSEKWGQGADITFEDPDKVPQSILDVVEKYGSSYQKGNRKLSNIALAKILLDNGAALWKPATEELEVCDKCGESIEECTCNECDKTDIEESFGETKYTTISDVVDEFSNELTSCEVDVIKQSDDYALVKVTKEIDGSDLDVLSAGETDLDAYLRMFEENINYIIDEVENEDNFSINVVETIEEDKLSFNCDEDSTSCECTGYYKTVVTLEVKPINKQDTLDEKTCRHCKDRKELAEAITECKNNNRPYNVTRSTLEGYRYDLTEELPVQSDAIEPTEITDGPVASEEQSRDIVPEGMSDVEIEITQKLMRVAEDTCNAIKNMYGYEIQPEFIVADMMQDLKLIGGELNPEDLEDTPINDITKQMFKGYNEFYAAMDEIMTVLTGESIETTPEEKLTQAIRELDGPNFTTEGIYKAIGSERFLTAAQSGEIPYIPAGEIRLLGEDLNESSINESIDLVETLKLDEASMSELKEITELCKQIGIETLGDLNRFVELEMDDEHKDKSLVDLLKDYLEKLGPDFKLNEFLNLNVKSTLNEDLVDESESQEEVNLEDEYKKAFGESLDESTQDGDLLQNISKMLNNVANDLNKEIAQNGVEDSKFRVMTGKGSRIGIFGEKEISKKLIDILHNLKGKVADWAIEEPRDTGIVAGVFIDNISPVQTAVTEDVDDSQELIVDDSEPAENVEAYESENREELLKVSEDVMNAYQTANKWLDSVKECVYTNMNCPFFSNFIHELAHTMPERFDKFGDILHTINMEIPYPATAEIDLKPQCIKEAFDVIFTVLDEIKRALNAFITYTDDAYHGMSCSAEACLNDIENEYPMLYRLQAKANECGDDTISFDKFVGQYVEHKDDLLENLTESFEDEHVGACPKCGKVECECDQVDEYLDDDKSTEFDDDKFDTFICEYFVENYSEGVIYHTESGKIDESGVITLRGIVESADSESEILFTLTPDNKLDEELSNDTTYVVTNNLSEEILSFKK